MPETSRQFRRPPEESITIEDFRKGMEIRVTKANNTRIISNMYPIYDGTLEGIRGDNTYIGGSTISWTGTTATSWLQDLHNENVAVFREGENKFHIITPASTSATSINQTSTYGTTARGTPLYGSKTLSTNINGWTVHCSPWLGWYEGIRTGIKGPLNSSSNWEWDPPKYLTITETGHFTTTSTDIKTQQMGLPVPIATGLHISYDHGVPFGSSGVQPYHNETAGAWTYSRMGLFNQWAMCVDNNYPTSKHAPVIHRFRYDVYGNNFINHSVFTQSGGHLMYSKDQDLSSATMEAQAKPIACCVDSAGTVFNAWIKSSTVVTINRHAAPADNGSAYSAATAYDLTTGGKPAAVQMAFDEFSDRVWIFVTCQNDTRAGANGSVVQVIYIDKDDTLNATNVKELGYIRLPADSDCVQQFTADFVCSGFESDAVSTDNHKRCIFGIVRGEDTVDTADLYWGYFDTTDTTDNANTLVSKCSSTVSPYSGGKVENLNIDRRYPLMMGTRSRDGESCDVVFSFISSKCGVDNNVVGHRVYASRNCDIFQPDLSEKGVFNIAEATAGFYGVDTEGNHTTLTSSIDAWKNVGIPLLKWDKYGTTFGSTGAYDDTAAIGSSCLTPFPAHRGDCLNRLPRTGDLYLRWEPTDITPNPLVQIHFDLDTANFIMYDSAEEPLDKKQMDKLEDTGLFPGEKGAGPLKPTGYPEPNHPDRTIGTGFTPHWGTKQAHQGLGWSSYTSTTAKHEFPGIFYPMTYNNNPALMYSYSIKPWADLSTDLTGKKDIAYHPPIHGGSAYHERPNFSEQTDRNIANPTADNWMRNNKLYAGANFHPLTPFRRHSGETGVDKMKTWNKKDPLLAGQDVNIISRVKTIADGSIFPGVYRYKFSFAKAGAEEKEYRSTGGEGAVFHDDNTEAFFEFDCSQCTVAKGLRFYFNWGLLKKYGGSAATGFHDFLFKTGATINTSSTQTTITTVWNGAIAQTVNWDRDAAPVPYDWWITHDIFTSPYTTTAVSGLKHSSQGWTVSSIDTDTADYLKMNIASPMDAGTWNASDINSGEKIYRHGQGNAMSTFTQVADKAPYVKKLIIWRTGDVSKPTTDKSVYYKVGEFDLADADDTRGWEGYYFDDVYNTLELSSKRADNNLNPPLSENITAIASSGGRLWIAHTPEISGEAAGHLPSTIQYSDWHFENFPRLNTLIMDDTAVVHHMKDFQGTLFVFTDEGVYAVTGTDDVATMVSQKVSSMIIHNHSNDGERTMAIDGGWFAIGVDGLYQLIEGGMVEVSLQVKEWFMNKAKVPLGMYYDKFTNSICVYQKTTTATNEGTPNDEVTIKMTNAAESKPRYMEAVCYHLPTQSWWCKTNTYANRRLYNDIISVGMNKESGTVQRYLPHPLVVGVRQQSTTVDNIIHIGKGWGQPKVDGTTGVQSSTSVDYIYESAAFGDAKVERYWDKIDVEIIPNAVQGTGSSVQTCNVQLDTLNPNSYAATALTYGTNVALTFKEINSLTDETYISPPALIETAQNMGPSTRSKKKSEFARVRLNFAWHDASDASSKMPPRLSALRFRTRVIGVDRPA